MLCANTPKRKIRCAIVGYRNNGKSTFTNALLRNNYTQTSRTDCTKSVLEINLVALDESAKATSPGDILTEIKKRNSSNHDGEDEGAPIHVIQPQQLVEMYHGLGLAVLDCPGHDIHAGCLDKLEFDMLICVVDAATCETEGQLELLAGLKKYIDENKKGNQPFLIALNKVDDPEDEDLQEQVKLLVDAIEETFGVDCRENALKRLFEHEGENFEQILQDSYPIVVKTSSKMAAKLLTINEMAEDQFKRLPSSEFKRIVELSLGKQGIRDLTKEDLVGKAYTLSRMDGENYAQAEQYETTGFPQVNKVVQLCIGGSKRQGFLASQQVCNELTDVKANLEGGYTARFEACQQEQDIFSGTIDRKANFELYKKLHEAHHALAKAEFEKSAVGAGELVKNFEELEQFYDNSAGSDADIEKWTFDQLTASLQTLLHAIVAKIKTWKQQFPGDSWRESTSLLGLAAAADASRGEWDKMHIADVILNVDSVLQEFNSMPDMIDRNALQCALSELKSFRNNATVEFDESGSAKLFGWNNLAEKIKQFAEKKKTDDLQRSLVSVMNTDLQKENARLHDLLHESLKNLHQGLSGMLAKESGAINDKLDNQAHGLTGMKRKLDAMTTWNTISNTNTQAGSNPVGDEK